MVPELLHVFRNQKYQMYFLGRFYVVNFFRLLFNYLPIS